MQSVEVQEDMREAANNLVKHFHKPEQEVCDCNSECAPVIQLLHSFNLLAHPVKEGEKMANAKKSVWCVIFISNTPHYVGFSGLGFICVSD